MDGHVCCFILTVLELKWHWKFRARFNSEESSLEVWHDRSGITSQAFIQRGTQAPAWLSGHIQAPSSHRAKLNKSIHVALSCTWRIPVSRHAFHLEEAQDTHWNRQDATGPHPSSNVVPFAKRDTTHTPHTLTRCNLSTCVNRAKTSPPQRSTRFVLQDGDCQEQILPQRAMVNDQPTRLTTTSLLQMALRFLSTKTVDPRGPALSGSLVLFSFVVLWLFGSFLRYKKYKDIFRPESPIWQWINYHQARRMCRTSFAGCVHSCTCYIWNRNHVFCRNKQIVELVLTQTVQRRPDQSGHHHPRWRCVSPSIPQGHVGSAAWYGIFARLACVYTILSQELLETPCFF